ncbi:MAG: hypothetical protein M1831_007552 [Alyxoria varia]|nr:MAG: hypothetical protein M1831_007552 [Alyxoria varia]
MPDDGDRSAAGQKPLGRFIGLPGRQIKLNTNITKAGASAPQEIFPEPDASSKNDRNGAGGQDTPTKRKLIPPRLQLRKELSPFDRYIPIALSIPNTANTFKSQGSQGATENGKDQSDDTKKNTRKSNLHTPVIIVTPTRSESSVSPQKALRRPKRNPRPPSSVYTRAMSTFGRAKTDQDVPPVPRTTNSGKSPSSSKWTGRSIRSPLSATVTSRSPAWSANAYKEIDSAQSAPEPIQTLSSTPGTIRASIDTALPTPRRSNGWWNLLVSPFLGNKTSPINRHRDNPLVDDDAPDVPVLDRAAPMSGSESCPADDRRSKIQSHHWLFDGEAAKYYDPTNKFGEASPRQGDASMYDRNSPDPDDEKGLDRAPTNEQSPENPKSPSPIMNRHYPKGHLRMPEPSEHRDSGVIVHKSSAEHRSANFHDTRHSIKSSSIDYDTMSPIVGVASAGQIHRARSIEARTPTPQPDASPNWPFKASASIRSSREIEQPKPIPFAHAARFDSRETEQPETTPFPRAARFERGSHHGQQYETHQRHHSQHEQSQHYLEKFPELSKSPQDNRRRTRIMHTYQKFKEEKGMTRNQERSFLITAAAFLLIVIILSVVLAMTVTHKHDDVPVETSWAKVAGFPSMPTGISTVSGPTVKTQAGCVARPELWQCSPPPETQNDSETGKGANFRFEIRSTKPATDEGSESAASSAEAASTHTATDQPSPAAPTASKMRFVKRAAIIARDALSDLTSTANPAPPSNDQIAFLGRTTDGTSKPYMGGYTPFTISVLPLTGSSVSTKPSEEDDDFDPDLRKRDTAAASASPSASPSSLPKPEERDNDPAFSRIPAPAASENQTAAPAQLYPHPYAQPLRIFNRGKPDEHYGFYTYFERSILLNLPDLGGGSTEADQAGNAKDKSNKDNAGGGVTLPYANTRCSWTQTRFRVQIWTRRGRGSSANLLPASASPTNAQNSTTPSDSKGGDKNSTTSSANDLTRPGSLPYPVTISLDRHGGSARGKGAYCYGVGELGRPDAGKKMLVGENRGWKGELVNPAVGAFQGGGNGESDGGTGGCSCTWENFRG